MDNAAPVNVEKLVALTSKAWSLRALALMHAGVPGRQAPLIAASGASRTSFVNSLDHLVAAGLLERNPGHGHPLRPEFRLTEAGHALAPLAHRIDALVQASPDPAFLRRAWTVPLLAVTRAPAQFSQIRGRLAPITDRALSAALGGLQERRWIDRTVDIDQRPPRPLYRAAGPGAEISAAVALVP